MTFPTLTRPGGGPDLKAIGHTVARLRERRKMTLQDLADASGLSKSWVWEIEQGRNSSPTVKSVWALADALLVSPAVILGLDVTVSEHDPLVLQVACLVKSELRRREA